MNIESEIEKQAAKDSEEGDRRRSEGRLHSISQKEADAAVQEADKIRKESRGAMRADFRDWWKGKGIGEGAMELAKWVFTEIANAIHLGYNEETSADPRNKDFKNITKPTLERLVEEVIQHGAQEDIVLYFNSELQNPFGYKLSQEVWDIYHNCLDKASGQGS